MKKVSLELGGKGADDPAATTPTSTSPSTARSSPACSIQRPDLRVGHAAARARPRCTTRSSQRLVARGEHDQARRPDRLRHRHGPRRVGAPARPDPRVPRSPASSRARRSRSAAASPSGEAFAQGLLDRADDLHRRHERHADRARGDLRPGARRPCPTTRRRGRRARQRLRLRAHRRCLVGRLRARARGRRAAARGNRLDQQLAHDRSGAAVRRLQAERRRPRARARTRSTSTPSASTSTST